MPEAIATTKRKLYKALETLSNPPATRQPEPPSKRIRYNSSSTASSVASRRITPSKIIPRDDSPNKTPPNFSPGSQDAFLARLKTYSNVSLWHPKPDEINEVQWARRGWTCVDINTVGCRGGCERRLVVTLGPARTTQQRESDISVEKYEADGDENAFGAALTKRYSTEIVHGHSEGCLWRRAGCSEDIYRLQVVRPSIWRPQLLQRYSSLVEIAEAIRDIKLHVPPEVTGSLPPAELLRNLSNDFPSCEQSSPASEISVQALEIALHGWRGSSDVGNGLLHCDACFQRIGLWMYQPGYKPSRFHFDTEDAEGSATVDLDQMHREYCPWRNGDTQKASGSLSGLNASQVLQRVISTHAREQRRKSEDQQKALRPHEIDGNEDTIDDSAPEAPPVSKDEVARLDKERESRLRKLKNLFTIKRRSPANASMKS